MGHPHHRTDKATRLDRPVPAAPTLVPAGQPRITVVGGSLTGPVPARALVQAGVDRVAGSKATSAAAILGGLISLEHSGLDVLDRLGIDQHEDVTAGVRHQQRPLTVRPLAAVTGRATHGGS